MADKFKSYTAPWQGQLILACRKCQKKLKGNPDLRALAKLKKTVKRHNNQHPEKMFHVINVPCMSMCPKDGVTIFNPAQQPVGLSVLRGLEDIEGIYCGL